MKQPPVTLEAPKLFPSSAEAYVAFCFVLIAAVLYTLYVGASAVWLDSLYYADRARHLLELGTFSQSPAYPLSAPLYSVLMMLGFVFPDMESGHRVLIIVQALLINSALFPLRALLLRASDVTSRQAMLLATGTLMLPCFLSYAPLLLPEALMIPLLIYGVYFLDRVLGGSMRKCDAIGAGLCLGLAWLTLYSAGILWLAALTALIPLTHKSHDAKQRQGAMIAALLPLLFFVPWLLINHGKEGMDLQLSLNNALARFNFGKNAFLYLIYGGAPLAGLALLLSGLLKGKTFWSDGFLRFAFTAFVALAAYAALTNNVIVDRKLDYFTNRLLEPYLFLPLIAFVRLDPAWRKDLLGNSLLLFFVLMIFGLPMGLHLDFQSGLAFWNGAGGATSAAGVIRDGLYMVLVAAPVAVLFLRPHWFMPAYTFVIFFMVAVGLSASAFVTTHNEDAKITNAEALRVYHDEELRKSDAIYVEYRCKTAENNDIAYLFGCYDLGRTLYFLPRLSTLTTADALLAMPPKQLANAVFVSSETDNGFGPVVAQRGMARFQRLSAQSLSEMAHTPIVQVEKIKGMRQYISLPIMDRDRRVTMLDPNSEITFKSSEAGCVRVQADWFADNHTQAISLQLDNGPTNKVTVPLMGKGPKSPVSFRLSLPKGESVLHIRYGDAKNPSHAPSLIMLERPIIKSCAGG